MWHIWKEVVWGSYSYCYYRALTSIGLASDGFPMLMWGKKDFPPTHWRTLQPVSHPGNEEKSRKTALDGCCIFIVVYPQKSIGRNLRSIGFFRLLSSVWFFDAFWCLISVKVAFYLPVNSSRRVLLLRSADQPSEKIGSTRNENSAGTKRKMKRQQIIITEI